MSEFEIILYKPCPLLQSLTEEKSMVNCPKCGALLSKGGKGKYFCENEHCSVIFVKCPSFPNRTKMAASSLAKPDKSIHIRTRTTLNLIEA
jgi:hypothetical protein